MEKYCLKISETYKKSKVQFCQYSYLCLTCVLPASRFSYLAPQERGMRERDFLHKHCLLTLHQASLPSWMLQPT